MSDELKQAEAEVEAHRASIREAEQALASAREELERLTPSGMLGWFRGSPDPDRVDQLEAVIPVLKADLRSRRELYNMAREVLEQLQIHGSSAPVGTDVADAEAAARSLAAVTRLDHRLTKLLGMAVAADTAREAVPLTRRGHRGSRTADPLAPQKRATAVAKHTEQWETVLDEAELLADIVGLPVVLPRRHRPVKRPPGAPVPDADVALARAESRFQRSEDFSAAISLVRSQIEGYQRRAWNTRTALVERFPEAEALAGELPFDLSEFLQATAPGEADGDAAGWAELTVQWKGLRAAYQVIDRLASDPRARTVDLLDPVGRWQRHATEVHEQPYAKQQGLLPPLNDGADLQAFVQRLRSEWPELDARYEALEAP
jgi:hypothetical protein